MPYPDGVRLWKLFSDTANDAPVDADILKQGVISLAEIGALEILTPSGGEKRSITALKLDDIVRVPPQATLLLPGRPRPLFARQPTYLAGPPATDRTDATTEPRSSSRSEPERNERA